MLAPTRRRVPRLWASWTAACCKSTRSGCHAVLPRVRRTATDGNETTEVAVMVVSGFQGEVEKESIQLGMVLLARESIGSER